MNIKKDAYKLFTILAVLIIILHRISIRNMSEKFEYPSSLRDYAIDKEGNELTEDQEKQRMGLLVPDGTTEVINPDDYYSIVHYNKDGTKKSGGENIYLRNKLNKEQELVKSVSQTDRNFNVDYNHGLYAKSQGWWADAINCEQNMMNFYCKPKKEWIWPY